MPGNRVINAEETFLWRQPIRNRAYVLVAYELLARGSRTSTVAQITDDAWATAEVMRLAFSLANDSPQVAMDAAAFVNVGAESLLSSAIERLPKEHVVLELLENIEPSARIVNRCRELKAMGYRLALDDFTVYRAADEPLLAMVDIVKIDVLRLDAGALAALVHRLRHMPVRLLAEKVESLAAARLCLALGFDLFQGFFFGRPALFPQ